MKKSILIFLLSVVSFSLYSQSWTPINGRQRFVSGLGIPVRDTITNTFADSAQILFRPYDSTLYYRFKGYWRMVGVGTSDTIYTGTNPVLTQSQGNKLFQQPFKSVTIKSDTLATSSLNTILKSTGNVTSRNVVGDSVIGSYNNLTFKGASGTPLMASSYINANTSGAAYLGYGQTLNVSGYTNGTYTNVPTTSTNGTGATLNITISGTSPQTLTAVVSNGGSGYYDGDTLIINNSSIGGTTGAIGIITTISNNYTPQIININKKSNLSNFYNYNFALYKYAGINKFSISYQNSNGSLTLYTPSYFNLSSGASINLNNFTNLYSQITQVRGYNEPFRAYDYYDNVTKFVNNTANGIVVNHIYYSGGISNYTIVGGSGYRDTTGNFTVTTSGYGKIGGVNYVGVTTSGGAIISVNFYVSGAYSFNYNFAVGDTIRFLGLPNGSGGYVLVTSVTGGSANGFNYMSTINDSTSATHYNSFTSNPTITTGIRFSGKIRGFYYNPTITQIGNGTAIGFENVVGNNYLNTTSGKTAIGYSSGATLPKTFSVKASINFNKDSIPILNRTKWKLAIDSATGNIVRDSVITDTTISAISGIFGTSGNSIPNASQKLKVVNNTSGADMEINGNGYGRIFLNDYSQPTDHKYYEMGNYLKNFTISRLNDANTTKIYLFSILDSKNVIIGNTITDNGAGILQLQGNIVPYTNNTYTNGTSSYAWSSVYAYNFISKGTVKLNGYTVATLPTGVTGMLAYVTDATATTYGTTVTGGGSNVVKVFYNGTNWIIN